MLNRKFLFIVMVVLALVLVACDNTDTDATETASANRAATQDAQNVAATESAEADAQATADAGEEATNAQATADAEGETTNAQATADAEEEMANTQATADAEGEMANTQATADAEEEMANAQATADAEEEMANTQATADAEEEMANAQATADAEGEMANTQATADAEEEMANAQATADAEEEMANAQATADAEEEMANTQATADAEEEMANAQATADAEEEMANTQATADAEEMASAQATADAEEEMANAEPTAVTGSDMMGPSVMLAPGEDVVIGYAGALSGEGLVQFGIDIRRGMELALEDRPSVTVGELEFTVTIDPLDSQCTSEGGQTVANRFVSDENIVAVVGPMCSSACEAAIPIFDEADFTTVSASCTAGSLTKTGSTSFNRSVPSDDTQGVAIAEFIFNTLGATKIAVIDDGSTYGEGLVEVVATTFEALGGEIVAEDAVAVGDTDFRALLEDVASAEPELIFFGGFNAEGARLVEQRVDVGLEDVQFMGADGIWGPEFIELAGSSADGVIASRPQPFSSDDLDAFNERYVETYGEEPPSAFNTNSYDATNMILDAVEAVGYIDDRGDLVVDRAQFADYIRGITGFAGLSGELNCDGTGECAATQVDFYQVTDGEYNLYSSE